MSLTFVTEGDTFLALTPEQWKRVRHMVYKQADTSGYLVREGYTLAEVQEASGECYSGDPR